METDKADLIPDVLIKDGDSDGGSSSAIASGLNSNSSPMRTLPRLRNQSHQPLSSTASTSIKAGSSSPLMSTPRRSPAPGACEHHQQYGGLAGALGYNSSNMNMASFPPGSIAAGAVQCLGCASAAAVNVPTSTLDSIMSKGTIGSRPRADSDHYYGDASLNIAGKSLPGEMRGYSIKQSRPIPFCLWFPLAKSLGIKLHENDKPWFGTIIYVLTLTFALTFAAANIWFLVYDIISITTRQTVLTGTVEMLIVIGWSSLGVYANGLAYNLFTNKPMLQSVRMHSKTIFKINSAGLMAILGVIFITLNNYSNFEEFYEHSCTKLGVNPWVCHLKYAARMGHSILSLVWNLLVGIVVLSVCRTHTIGIRRFIRDLEEDGLMYIQYTRDVIHNGHSRIDDIMHNFDTDVVNFGNSAEWIEMNSFIRAFPDDSEDWEEMSTMENDIQRSVYVGSDHSSSRRNSVSPRRQSETPKPRTRNVTVSDNPPVIKVLDKTARSISSPGDTPTACGSVDTNPSMVNLVIPDPPSQISQVSKGSSNQESAIASTRVELGSPRQMPSPDSTDLNMSIEQDQFAVMPNCFTAEDILLSYWKISCRLRTTSRIMQRWLASWITFIIFYDLTYIIYWLNHAATFIGIAEFIIPLLLLPLVCSAYAEVNFEGQRMLRCICPTENRIKMLYYMNLQPLRMTVFGFSVNYSALLKVFSAILLAFASRLILDEIRT
ncbi:uncharacterized protein LOC135502918 isoform X2 [Lineus longissimus]|uniref:uncharacterized protein LOC135502918 isoform X2 n=1 Tax=Lineus longissimus TaxID=88925 RepID=UPI00315CF9F5